MGDSKTATLQVSTAQQFRAAAEARRAAQKTLEAALSPDQISQAKIARQRRMLARMPRINTFTPGYEALQRSFGTYSQMFDIFAGQYMQLNQAVNGWQSLFNASVIAELQRTMQGLAGFRITFETDKIYTDDELDQASVSTHDSAADNCLEIKLDAVGNTIIDGRTILRANAYGSRHGKLLQFLEANKGKLLTKNEIREHLHVVDVRRVFKDLYKDLRQAGYNPVVKSRRQVGYVYEGIFVKQ